MTSFTELNLSEPLNKAITALGFSTPSPIQAQALPTLLGEPTDFIGLAATGTGKTATFAIPLLEKIDPNLRKVQGLILCPTRELALQVAGQIDLLGKFMGIRALPIYGGSSYGDQIYGLKNGATIVVGTPGRVIDHMEKGTLTLDSIKTLILDEADEMISMGFKDDLETILKASPREESQIWLFSATMSKEVRRVADTYLRNPKQVQVNRTEMLSNTVEQLYYFTRESDKPEILCKLIESAEDFYGIVFCQTKALVTDLTQYLQERGYKVDCLHGDKDQTARERTMQAFRTKRVSMLICTDVASRGLDVKDITHVINYSIPRELDIYVHRIGRTARSGKSGIAMSLVTPSHRQLIGRIESMTKSRMKEGKIPSRRDIGAKRALKILGQFKEQNAFPKAIDLLGEEWKQTVAEMSPEEIVGRFLVLNSPDLFIEREEPKARQMTDSRDSAGAGRREDGRRGDRRGEERRGGNRGYDRGGDRGQERGQDRFGGARRDFRAGGEDRRDSRSEGRRPVGVSADSKPFFERRSEDRQPENRRPEDRRPDFRRSEDRRPSDRRSDDRRSTETRSARPPLEERGFRRSGTTGTYRKVGTFRSDRVH